MTPSELGRSLRDLPSAAGVILAVLHGSRARGDSGPEADWDVAIAGHADLAALTADLTELLGTDAVDVVQLERASALLRFRTARDGVLLVGDPAEFERFRIEAVSFWCDAGPVIRAAQEDVLAALG